MLKGVINALFGFLHTLKVILKNKNYWIKQNQKQSHSSSIRSQVV